MSALRPSQQTNIEVLLEPAVPFDQPETKVLTVWKYHFQTFVSSNVDRFVSNSTVEAPPNIQQLQLPARKPDGEQVLVHPKYIRLLVDEQLVTDSSVVDLTRVHLNVYTAPSYTAEIAPHCETCQVPCSSLEGLWESLHYSTPIKSHLLGYISARFSLCKSGLNSSGLVILHGKPGTGKTTICRALAQKMGIRMGKGQMIHLKLDAILSKWFAESANNVAAQFEQIKNMKEPTLVILDEVESICLSRCQSVGIESGDTIRVVNALLKGIDNIRSLGNITVICTSNLLQSIDEAFIDRADMVHYIDMMGDQERNQVIHNLFQQLKEKQIIYGSADLQEVIKACEGLSGRRICGLPVVALSLLGAVRSVAIGVFAIAFIEAARLAKNIKEDK